jgi:hypothetical protein
MRVRGPVVSSSESSTVEDMSLKRSSSRWLSPPRASSAVAFPRESSCRSSASCCRPGSPWIAPRRQASNVHSIRSPAAWLRGSRATAMRSGVPSPAGRPPVVICAIASSRRLCGRARSTLRRPSPRPHLHSHPRVRTRSGSFFLPNFPDKIEIL